MELTGLQIKEGEDGCTLTLKVIPKASHTQIVGVEAGALKIKVQAPPVEGAANEAVTEYLAKCLRKPKSSVVLIRGGQSRHKVVCINGMRSMEVMRAMENHK